MTRSVMYHDGNRRLQDQFDSRRISDRLEEKLTRKEFTSDDKGFIEKPTLFLSGYRRRQREAGLLVQRGRTGFRARNRTFRGCISRL